MRHLPCQDYSKHLNVKSFNPHNNLIFPAFRMWEERSPRPKATGQVHGPQQAGELQGPHPCSASPATPHSGWLSLAGAGAGGGVAAWQHAPSAHSPSLQLPPCCPGLSCEPAARCYYYCPLFHSQPASSICSCLSL